MYYPLAISSWTQAEKDAIQRVVNSGQHTMGPEIEQFETEFAQKFGVKHAIMVNSGSSANLLAVGALIEAGALSPGDEVIVPAVSWGTSYFPLHQYGLKLVFCDINEETLNIDPNMLYELITDKTKAIFAVNLLGNPCNYVQIEELCRKHKLILLEDNCESLGAKYLGAYTGTYGTIGTFSFFFSHHLQTTEGGMVVTDDTHLMQYIKSLRSHGWVRNLEDDNDLYQKTNDPFTDNFKFVLPGYCVRSTEICAAIGREQLKKCDNIIQSRVENGQVYRRIFGDCEWCDIQKQTGRSSWFAFPFILKGPLGGKRKEVIEKLTENDIETRAVLSGNFLNQPVIKRMNYSVPFFTPNAERVDSEGFLIGNCHKPLQAKLKHVKKLIEDMI